MWQPRGWMVVGLQLRGKVGVNPFFLLPWLLTFLETGVSSSSLMFAG